MIERDVAELRARVAKLEWALDHLSRQLGVALPAAPTPTGVSAQVIALVRRGDKMGAIKAYVAETGADLGAAKKVVDALE